MIATATVLRIKILVLVAVFAVGLMLGFGISASSLHVQASVQRDEPMPLFNEAPTFATDLIPTLAAPLDSGY